MEFIDSDLIQTDFIVKTEWEQGFTGVIKLANLGENLTEWTIEFESPWEIYSDEIWGAEIVQREGDRYTLKPVDYNNTIYANQGTEIIFNANKINSEILAPQNIKFSHDFTPNDVISTSEENIVNPDQVNEVVTDISTETETTVEPVFESSNNQDNLSAAVNFNLISDWGSGFQGSISITNNSGSNIDTWNLEFDFPNQINNIWDAEIEQNQNGSYVITHARWNREIPAGETLTFGFTGEDSVKIEPQNFALDGFTFDSPSIYQSIYTYENPDLTPELELDQEYQGRATFYDAANPSGGLGASGFDVPTQNELHKIVAINNIQWHGSEASGAFLKVSGPKQREGAEPIVVQVVDHLVERADGLDMSAEAFAKIGDPIDGTVNIEYQLIGPADDYVTAYGYSIGQGIVVETITGTNPYYAATRLNNHRYPIASVELIEDDGDLIELNRESDNRFVMDGNYPLYGVQDLLVTDIFGQQVTLDDIDITNSSSPDTITGEQFAMI